MTHQQILDFNEYLIRNDSRYDIFEYIHQINNMYEKPIDLSFMEELLSLVEKDECCVPHTLLVKYGAFKEQNASSNVKTTLELYEFIENIDYLLLNVQEQVPSGIKHKNIYYLHPNTFKMILMRSKCEKKYAKYYLLLEKSIKYYHEYQILYKNNEIKILSERINDQSKQIQELINNSKETKEKLKETSERLSDVEEELATTSNNLESTMVDLSIVQDKLDISVEDRAVKPFDKQKINQIVILRSKENIGYLYLTCGQKDSVARATRLRNKTHDYVTTIEGVPNSIYLFDHIKKELGYRVKAVSRTVKLINIEEPEFIDRVKALFDGRRNVDLTKKPE